MNFAILGTDTDILHLAAATRAAGHEIVWIGDIRTEDAASIGPLTTHHTDRAAEWELILDRAIADGVLVGRGTATSDLRAEQLKRLAAEAMPLLVSHPVFDSVLPYYEIDMTRRETGAIIQHFNPLIGLPETAELAECVRAGHPVLGPIHQLTCERRMAGASRSAVIAHLARDVELLAAVAGDIRRVSAIGPASLEASFASLQVQMTATNITSLRWSVGSAATNAAGLQVTLLGERGTVTLRELNDVKTESPEWEIEVASEGPPNVRRPAVFDAAGLAIERFVAAVAETNGERRVAASTWEAATRSMEVVDAIELSLQKGRTIEVFQQHLTEQLAFRGTMAALGCGLLLIVFLAAFGVALLGGAEGILEKKIAPAWPLLLLAVLAFFLFLQAIPMLAQKSKKQESTPTLPPPDGS
jgi:predicted dehydrogenase